MYTELTLTQKKQSKVRVLYLMNEDKEATDTLFFCSDVCRGIAEENAGADHVPISVGMSGEYLPGTVCDDCGGPLEKLSHVATDGDNINPVLVWSGLDPKGRYLLRGIFTDMGEANAFMAENHDTGLLSEFGPFLLVADLKVNLKGVKRG